jgi:hypothetical protein
MNDYHLTIDQSNIFFLEIESNIIGDVSTVESSMTIESSDQSSMVLLVEASASTDLDDIVVEKFDVYNLEIITHESLNSYVIPDNIPIGKIVGNLHVTRIDGLDEYLDSYTFDCGTP